MKNTIWLKRAAISILFLYLSACALINTYNLDPSSPPAKLGIQPNTGVNPIIIFKDYRLCQGLQTIPLHGPPTEINAGTPTTLLVRHVFGYDPNVIFPISFTPKANHTYLVQITSKKVDSNIEFTFHLLDNTSNKMEPTFFIERKIDLAAFSYECTDSNDISKNKILSIKRQSHATQIII